MHTRTHSLLDLIDNTLDIFKIKIGEFELPDHPFAYDALAARRIIAVLAQEKGIHLRRDAKNLADKWLTGDQTRLQQKSLPTGDAAESQRVLLVEDYPGNIIVATTLLEELGYSCDIAHNGTEALDFQAQGTEYHVVLMDVNMPGMDGLTATREWRKREAEKGLPHSYIIGLTAHTLAGDDERCIEAGMDRYFAKPLTLEILQSVLNKPNEAGA